MYIPTTFNQILIFIDFIKIQLVMDVDSSELPDNSSVSVHHVNTITDGGNMEPMETVIRVRYPSFTINPMQCNLEEKEAKNAG